MSFSKVPNHWLLTGLSAKICQPWRCVAKDYKELIKHQQMSENGIDSDFSVLVSTAGVKNSKISIILQFQEGFMFKIMS